LHHIARRPAPRPRNSPRSGAARRKRASNAAGLAGDDEFEFADEQEDTTVIAFPVPQDDGGKDQGEQDRQQSRDEGVVRLLEDAAEAKHARTLGALDRRQAVNGIFPSQRYVRSICGLLAAETAGAAATGGPPDTAARMLRLQLELQLAVRGTPRRETGGLARVRQQLLAYWTAPARAPAAEAGFEPDALSRIARLQCMLPLLLLQMQCPRTRSQARRTIAWLQVMTAKG
jgi:hypothetical protein